MTATLCLQDFCGLHFSQTEFLQDKWKPHLLQHMVPAKPKPHEYSRSFSTRETSSVLGLKVAEPEAQGLSLAGDSAYLHGVALHNLQYHPSSNSISFGRPAEDAPIGQLYFTADRKAFVGQIAPKPTAEITAVRGLNSATYYRTQRQEGKGPFEEWENLVIGTKWETEAGNTILKHVVTLGSEDISNRVAVVATSNIWDTTFHMAPSQSDLFNPDLSEFTILLKLQATEPFSIFEGTYTDQFGKVYNWKGSSYTPTAHTSMARAHRALLKAPKPSPPIGLRSTSLNVLDLLNLSPLQPDGKKLDENGEETDEDKYKDLAQEKTAEYFQKMLIASLPGGNENGSWLSQLYGPAPVLTDGVKKIQEEHREWLEEQAVPNFGQLLLDNVRDGSQKDTIEKIDGEKLAKNYRDMGKSEEYGRLSQKLYIEGFRDAVKGISPYIDDKTQDWGQNFFNYLTSPTFLNIWATQVASGMFKNVKETMYQHWVKLSILCPDDVDKEEEENRPNMALTTMLATILNTQYSKARWVEEMLPFLEKAIDELLKGTADFGEEILDRNAAEQKELLSQLLSTYDTQAEFAVFLSRIFNRNRGKPAMATATEEIVEEVENESRFRKFIATGRKWASRVASVAKILGFAAIAGYFLSQVIGEGGNNVLADIGFTVTATAFLVRGVQDLLATKLGSWIATKVSALNGRVANMMKNFTAWFSKAGVESSSWAAKVFGKSSAEFLGKRLGPALAVFGIAICSYNLSKAVKTGDVPNIIFESLNLSVAILTVVFIGLELLGFAWAGPVGLAIAVIGVIIVVVQLFYNIFNPPTPPPDPVERFVDGPLKQAGFVR